jgi:hypothetical protein
MNLTIFQIHLLVYLLQIPLSFNTDPLDLVSRAALLDYFAGEDDCAPIPFFDEHNLTASLLPMENIFTVDSAVDLITGFDNLMTNLSSSSKLRVSIQDNVPWSEVASLSASLLKNYEWFRNNVCKNWVKFPTPISKGADEFDSAALQKVQSLVDKYPDLLVLFPERLPSLLSIMNPRPAIESLRIFTDHNLKILLNKLYVANVDLTETRARLVILETQLSNYVSKPKLTCLASDDVSSCDTDESGSGFCPPPDNTSCKPHDSDSTVDVSGSNGVPYVSAPPLTLALESPCLYNCTYAYGEYYYVAATAGLTISLLDLCCLILMFGIFCKRNYALTTKNHALKYQLNKANHPSSSADYGGNFQPAQYTNFGLARNYTRLPASANRIGFQTLEDIDLPRDFNPHPTHHLATEMLTSRPGRSVRRARAADFEDSEL